MSPSLGPEVSQDGLEALRSRLVQPAQPRTAASCQTWAKEALHVLVGGIGLLSDGFDVSVINLVRASLERMYPVQDWERSWQRSLITASSIFGAMLGMVVLGALADRLGRRRLLLVSGGLTFVGALGSACAFDFGSNHNGFWASLVAWRAVMGFGIGGEYPLSAAHTAEHAESEVSGRRMALGARAMGRNPGPHQQVR